jgi:hypothetical protein
MFLEKLIFELIRPSTTVPKDDAKHGSKLAAKVSMRVMDVAIMIIAILVAWDCNYLCEGFMKYIFVLYAALFPTVYLSFYLIYRIILNNPCYETPVQ